MAPPIAPITPAMACPVPPPIALPAIPPKAPPPTEPITPLLSAWILTGRTDTIVP